MISWLRNHLGLRGSFRWAVYQMEKGKVVYQTKPCDGVNYAAPIVYRIAPNKWHIQRTVAVDKGTGFPWQRIPMDMRHIKNTSWRIYPRKFVAKKVCRSEDFGFIDRILFSKEKPTDTYESKGE